MDKNPKVWTAMDKLVVRSHTKYLSEKSRIELMKAQNIDIVFNLDKVPDPIVAAHVPTIHTPPAGDKRTWLWATAESVVQNLNAGRKVLVHDDTGFERSAAVAAVVRRLMLGETSDAAIDAVKKVQPLAFRTKQLGKMVAAAPEVLKEVKTKTMKVPKSAAAERTPRLVRRRRTPPPEEPPSAEPPATA